MTAQETFAIRGRKKQLAFIEGILLNNRNFADDRLAEGNIESEDHEDWVLMLRTINDVISDEREELSRLT